MVYMNLNGIPPQARVFIDANIFIYHFTGASHDASDFLLRCESGEYTGITSINVILEVLHRLMMVEAVRKGLVQPPNIMSKLKKHPHKVKQLDEYFRATEKIEQMGIIIKPVPTSTILRSQAIRLRYGLLINDSIILTVMEEEMTKYLATNDKDFSKIDNISVFSPEDI